MLKSVAGIAATVAVIGWLTAHKVQRVTPDAPSAAAAQPVAAARANAPAGAASAHYIPRDRSGHFSAIASVRGDRVDFMVDTGATVVALTHADAERLRILPSARDYSVRMHTANGVVRAAKVRLAEISIGPITVQDVDAVVLPKGALAQNLLGMSFLSRLRRFEFRSGQLVLEQ